MDATALGALLGILVTCWLAFGKQPGPRQDFRTQPGAASDPIHDQTLALLDAIDARPQAIEEYHDHHHYAPQPTSCRYCRAANHPYAPTCSQCGAPIH